MAAADRAHAGEPRHRGQPADHPALRARPRCGSLPGGTHRLDALGGAPRGRHPGGDGIGASRAACDLRLGHRPRRAVGHRLGARSFVGSAARRARTGGNRRGDVEHRGPGRRGGPLDAGDTRTPPLRLPGQPAHRLLVRPTAGRGRWRLGRPARRAVGVRRAGDPRHPSGVAGQRVPPSRARRAGVAPRGFAACRRPRCWRPASPASSA